MADKLIYAGELMRKVQYKPGLSAKAYKIIQTLIDEAPEVEAIPAAPAHWIPRIDNETPMHECSRCGSRVVKGFYEYENPNLYCYHCGAKMEADNG